MASSDPFIACVRAPGPPPGIVQVLGERSSGTNVVQTAIKRNLGLAPSDLLGWKHGFPHMLAVPARMLVVAVVRDAFDWSLSMHAKPWHAAPRLQRMDYAQFIRAPWESRVDRRDYFGLDKGDPRIGAALQLDRHPLTGAAFGNIFEMRNAKVAALLGMANRGCNFAMLRLEAFREHPEDVLAALAARFELAPPADYRPVNRRLGARFATKVADRPATPNGIGADDRAFILSALDSGQESRLGYAYERDSRRPG